MRTVEVALRPTQAIPHQRALLARYLLRLLMITGGLLACWLLGLVLAANAHAAEQDAGRPDSAGQADSPGTLELLTGAVGDLVGSTDQHGPNGVDPASPTADEFTDTSTALVGSVVDTATRIVDDTSDSADVDIDNLTPVLPGDNNTTDNRDSLPDTTKPRPQPQDTAEPAQPHSGAPDPRVPPQDARPTPPKQVAAKQPQPAQPAPPVPATPERPDHRSVRHAGADSESSLSGTTPPPLDNPAVPQPSAPVNVAPSATAGHDGSASGKHVYVIGVEPPNNTRLRLLATSRDLAAHDTRDDPALPHASPG